MDKKRVVEIQPLIELAIFIVALLGTIIPLHLHLDNKMEKSNEKTRQLIECIREDIRDFHGRLCAIEERRGK